MTLRLISLLENTGVSNRVRDALTEVLREGAQALLVQAVEAEVAEFLGHYRGKVDSEGRARMVRNGYLPERTIQTGIGDVPVKAPRVRDRTGEVRFSSSILPRYLRRTKTIEELLPWLYLKGISTGGFSEALACLLGRDAPGLSAGTISRLKAVWQDEHAHWEKRSLVNKRYVYLWVDGIHFGVRLEEANQCILVVIGATAEGKKELVPAFLLGNACFWGVACGVVSQLSVSSLHFTIYLSPEEKQTCRLISLVLYLLRITFLLGAQIERKISLANEDARPAGSAAFHRAE